ncbi:MAG: GTP-binding protein [Clostridia bacterium]|nr:GTP-binding protein [Clostridia bacterium]
MTKIDIFSGFLGAGKTTLIKKLIREAYTGEKLVLIENEFGEIGIDGGFMQDAGVNVTEMNSGCICCSLVGDFGRALKKVIEEYKPDRVLIEPSGVGKLSDVIKAVLNAGDIGAVLNGFTTVVDANKCKMYIKNFGEFFNNQVEYASCIVLSRTGVVSEDKVAEALELLRSINGKVTIITTPWEELSGAQILEAMEQKNSLQEEIRQLQSEIEHDDEDDDDEDEHEHHHHHHHGDGECNDPNCSCHHHHDNDDDEEEHEHHHHHHHDEDDDEDEHEHHHHHHGDGECDDPNCSCHHHHHHHGHDADEVFTSWGVETNRKFSLEEVQAILEELDVGTYGQILRAKGILPGKDGAWIHYDYVPGESNVRTGSAIVTGRICVIGSELKEDALAELFHVAHGRN